MATQHTNINFPEINSIVGRINQARQKVGLATFSITNPTFKLSSTMQTLRDRTVEANSRIGQVINMNGITGFGQGQIIRAALFDEIYSKATEILMHCSCDCNRCSCDCNRCSCDCDRCSCNCDRCSCDATCSCNSTCMCHGKCACHDHVRHCSCDCALCPQCPDQSCGCNDRRAGFVSAGC